MNKSNIFVFIELQKFVSNLKLESKTIKQDLLNQHSYFKIIPPAMFRDDIGKEWEEIQETVKKYGPKYDDENNIVANEIKFTIENMSTEECIHLTESILKVFSKVKAEYSQ